MIKVILNKEDLSMIPESLFKEIEVISHKYQDGIQIEFDQKHLPLIEKVLAQLTLDRKSFIFETKDGWVRTFINEIIYIEAFAAEIIMYTTRGKIFLKTPLYKLEEMLSPYHVVRISKSYLVNLGKVRYIKSVLNAKLELEVEGSFTLEVTRSYVKSFKISLGIGGF